MKFTVICSLLPLLASAAFVPDNAKLTYDGWRVLRVKSSPDVASLIAKHALDVWNGKADKGGYVDVAVPPGFTALDGPDTSVMHENLGTAIDEESKYEPYAAGSVPNITWFNSYHPYATHLQYLNDLQAAHPVNSEIVTMGNSALGRPITGIHFYGTAGAGVKPAVVIHSTVHAREWVTTMVTEYFAWSLLTNYTTDPATKSFVDEYDFYIFPVVNPDGFHFSQANQRLWRKNRVPNTGSSCVGTDPNRNWNFKWDVPGGASTDPCEDDYKGTAGFSAPETVVFSNFLNGLANSSQGLELFVDYHSYSQLFMTPYGYSCTALPANNAQYQSLAQGAAAAIKAVFGTVFQAGPICTTIYQATGSSVDYVNDVTGSKWAFTSELRDTGTYGFVLPADQILPSALEAFAGFEYLLANI